MKRWISLLLLISTTTLAQDVQKMNENDIEAMMKQMQEMQACMAKVDQSELKALEQRWTKLNAELNSLCNQGKRDAAQKKALSLSKETARSSALQTMAKCTENMRGMMAEMPFMNKTLMNSPEDYAEQHVCDNLL